MIGMPVTPIPVRPLFFHSYFNKRPVLSVPLPEVHAVGTVFALIPIVIILVVAIVNPVVVLIVPMVFFLPSIILRPGTGADRRRRCDCCGKKKGTEKILISTMHFFFLLAPDFPFGIFDMRRVFTGIQGKDVRYRTPPSTLQIHSRILELSEITTSECDLEVLTTLKTLGRLSFIA